MSLFSRILSGLFKGPSMQANIGLSLWILYFAEKLSQTEKRLGYEILLSEFPSGYWIFENARRPYSAL